jgi:hypothetical protein
MATPGDQLVLAFDYVKSNTLKGQHYLVSDIPRVALELRKFLAADKDKQILALQAERENAVLEAQKENHLRRDAEQRIRDAIARNEELDEQVGVLTKKLADTDRQVDELQKASIKSTERQEALDLIRKRNAAIAYGFGAVVLLILLNQVAGVIADAIPWPWPDSLRSFVTSTLRVIAAVMIAIPTTRYIRETAWSENRKTVALVVVGGVSILVSKIITPSVLNGMADLIEVAALFAAVVIAVWFNRDDGEKKKG